MKLYALHDKKAKSLSNFVVERSDAVATRFFAEAVLQPNSVIGKYPDDFELVALCDVSQDYGDQFHTLFIRPLDADVDANHELVGSSLVVVVTARQVVDMQPKADGQLSLLKEA